MADKVLLVDDEENLLHGYARVLRGRFPLEVALGGLQAIQALADRGPFAVIVADMRMPGMTGLDVLREAAKRAPETSRIMLTGDLDQKTAIDAVNHGQVFRFLNKPCSPEVLAGIIQAGIRQHQMVVAEKELLQETLMGSLQMLTDLLSNLDPEAFGRGRTLRERARELARILRFEAEWDLETAALLLPIGRIALPPELLAKLKAGAALDPREQGQVERIPETGARLLDNIPRLHQVAQFVRYHAKGFDGSGEPVDAVAGEELPLGARILKVLNDFTQLERKRQSRAIALGELALHPARYDRRVLEALYAHFGTPATAADPAAERACGLEELRVGMVLSRDILAKNERRVLVAGLMLGTAHLLLLRDAAELLGIHGPVHVWDP